MMIQLSSKGKYTMLLMLELSLRTPGKYVPLKEIALKHNISSKYLEQIAGTLSKGGLLDAIRGLDGGYRLKKLHHNILFWKYFCLLKVTE